MLPRDNGDNVMLLFFLLFFLELLYAEIVYKIKSKLHRRNNARYY